MAEQVSPQVAGEIARARREMLNHLSQRENHLPLNQIKRYMQDGARSVWRSIIRADREPKRTLHMPGRR